MRLLEPLTSDAFAKTTLGTKLQTCSLLGLISVLLLPFCLFFNFFFFCFSLPSPSVLYLFLDAKPITSPM